MATKSSLGKLPLELRSEIFEYVFPEGHTTVSFTAFCNLATNRIDVYRLKSDGEVATPGTLQSIGKFNTRTANAVVAPLGSEIMNVFWRNAKVIINITNENARNPFEEFYVSTPTFLEQAAGRLQHLTIKICLTRTADSQALAKPGFQDTFFSCHQDVEIKTFAHRAKEGRMPYLSVTSQQLLGITHRTGATSDLTMREEWCRDFLTAAREPAQGRGLSGAAVRILLLKLSSFDSMTTSNSFLTVPPALLRRWKAMDAVQAGGDLTLGMFISPASNTDALALPPTQSSGSSAPASTSNSPLSPLKDCPK